MKHILNINSLSDELIHNILRLAASYKQERPGEVLKNQYIANIFLENSTRTSSSFAIAAMNLGARVLDLHISRSSVQKGESLSDSLQTLALMGVRAAIIRHPQSGVMELLASEIALINAGDGCHQHPSQALLDSFTIEEHFGHIAGLTVVICGDILHSRVAKSNIDLLTRLGAKIRLCGPRTLVPPYLEQVEIYDHLEEALPGADIVMMLRLQLERMNGNFVPSFADYASRYCLREQHLELGQFMIMHPGPVNRDVEIESRLVESERSLIWQQVKNGVFIREAILSYILEKKL